MNEETLLTKKSIKKNKLIKQIQKGNKGKCFSPFTRKYPKASIPKIINNSGFMDVIEKNSENNYYLSDGSDLLADIKMSNLKGGSGNGFLVYKKIETFLKSPKQSRKIIINAVECDPGLIQDEWLLRNKAKEIVAGIHTLQKLLDSKDVILAKKEAVNFNNFDINIFDLPNLYPLGEEHILIKKVLGVSFEKNEIPAQKGILVMNVQTLLAIQEIANHSYIEGSKYITVADYTTGEAKVVKIKSGMEAAKVLQAALGERADKYKFIGGGALAGAHSIQTNELITEETSMIAYGKKIDFANAKSCVHCGSCSRNCPAGIPVKHIIMKKGKNINADVSEYKPDRCLKCSTCTYQCHAGINVMQYINNLL